jgi:hypothetical protein
MIIDHIRNLAEFWRFYHKYPMPEEVQYDFDFIVNNPNLYCFYDVITGELKAYITIQREDGKLTLSGASCRKNFLDNINAIIKVCNAQTEDVYAITKVKQAKLLLRKAGFKKIEQDLFVRYKNG